MGRQLTAEILRDAGPVAGEWDALHGGTASRWLSQSRGFFDAATRGGTGLVAVVRGARGEALALASFHEQRRGRARLLRHLSPASFAGVLRREGDADPAQLADSLAGAIEGASSRATIVLAPGDLDARAFVWRGWRAQPHYNLVSRVGSAGEFESRMSPSARRQARKAARSGVTVEAVADFAPVAALRRMTERRQGFRDVVADAGYAALLDGGSGARWDARAAALVARDREGRTHAAGLFACDARRSYYLLGASDPAHLGSGAPTLLHLEAVRYFESAGWPLEYDWVGGNDPGTARFKAEFAPELEVLVRVEWRATSARILDAVRGLG